MSGYAVPEVLVSTQWVADHLDDPEVALVEVDVDTTRYEQGHIPGATGWSWKTDLCDTVQRDILSRQGMEQLLGASGIRRDQTIVLYGDSHNWFAAWAFWQLEIYGHPSLRIMNGGRNKWEQEERPLTRERPERAPTAYRASEPDASVRARLHDVQLRGSDVQLVDVRGPQEFSGEILAPPGLPETCQRGGHIPGARNIPWSMAVNDGDSTFRGAAALREIYGAAGLSPDRPVITYCRIGERSSHTWFVLKYLLGFPGVRNYDGSWTEWGNLVGAPVEKGS